MYLRSVKFLFNSSAAADWWRGWRKNWCKTSRYCPKNTFKIANKMFKTLNISGIVMPGPLQDGYVPGQGKPTL